MKRLLRFSHRAALYSVLCSLSALALLLSGLRLWLLPAVSDFRQALETRIGALIGETVRIDALSARLHGFRPELSVSGFHILDPEGRSAIRFSTVRLDLDTFRTVAAGEPRFDRVEVIGPRLSLRRRRDGSLAVIGLTVRDQPPAWLLAGGRIDLLDAEVDWQDARTEAPPLALGRMNLSLRNDGSRHRLSAGFALPENLGRSLRLVLDATGDLFSAAGWDGTVYLEGQGLTAGRLAAALPPPAFGLRAGTADARIWVRWEGALRSVAGEFQIRDPVFGHRLESGTENRLAMKAVGSRFHWERQPEGWRLDLDRFKPALNQAWPETRLAVAVRRQADGSLTSVSASASHLDLADLRRALESLALLDGDTGAELRSLAPRGTLGNLRFFHAPAASRGERWAFCGRFRDLGLNARGSIPAFAGLRGEACGTDGAGRASLSAAPGKLDLPSLGIGKPISLTRMQAGLSWRQTEDGWILACPFLSAHNNDFTAESRGRLVLPKAAGGSPVLDLETRLTGVDVAALPRYLPAAFIPNTAEWAERSLTGGRISRWDIRFRGPTAAFPFYENDGVFEADIDVQNLTLRFHPDWLPLAQGDAHLEFRGPRMEFALRRGRIGKGELVGAEGSVQDINRDPQMAVTGTIRAGVADTLDYLAQSPLREIPEHLGRYLGTSGNTEIALKLGVPLGSTPGETSVEGTATFRDAGLLIDAADLRVENLEGPLRFGPGGLSADGLRARILGEPALIGVAREKGEVRIDLRGRAAVAALQRQFPAEFWRYARGAADYRLSLRVPETLDTTRDPLRLRLNSDLDGLALDLPEPLGKPEPTPRPLSIEASFDAPGGIPLTLAYGPELRARLRFANKDRDLRMEGGTIAIGHPLPAAEGGAGLSLHARVDGLDLSEWWRWWTAMPGSGMDGGLLRELDLQIGKPAWNGRNLGRLALEMRRDADRWRGRIDTAYGRGEISVSPDALRFDLDTLKLPEEPPADGAPAAADSFEPDPAVVPSLRLRARRLLWKNADLGPLELETERHAHGMIVKKLAVAATNHRLELHGDWTRTPNRAAGTHVEGKVHIDSLGEFLAGLGSGGKVRDTPSDAEFSLDWPGAPYRFSASTAAGSLKLNLGKGSLLEVEPGLGRVIGVLNLNSLWRRLSLDFSDLFGKGLGYDGIAGTFRIGGGQAVTEGFLIDAVSARILATGRVGLVARDLDQTVAVIPHTSAALPIAGALAGGPAVGAAVYVAQKLIGEEVDSIAATHYTVRGPWDNPTITRTHDNLPLDVLDRAWTGVKNLPVFGDKPEDPPQ